MQLNFDLRINKILSEYFKRMISQTFLNMK